VTPILEVRCYAPMGKQRRPHRKLLASMYRVPGQAPSLVVEDGLIWRLHDHGDRPMLTVNCPVHGTAFVDLAHTREVEGAATRAKPNVLQVLA
jgi:hypothetical protein